MVQEPASFRAADALHDMLPALSLPPQPLGWCLEGRGPPDPPGGAHSARGPRRTGPPLISTRIPDSLPDTWIRPLIPTAGFNIRASGGRACGSARGPPRTGGNRRDPPARRAERAESARRGADGKRGGVSGSAGTRRDSERTSHSPRPSRRRPCRAAPPPPVGRRAAAAAGPSRSALHSVQGPGPAAWSIPPAERSRAGLGPSPVGCARAGRAP